MSALQQAVFRARIVPISHVEPERTPVPVLVKHAAIPKIYDPAIVIARITGQHYGYTMEDLWADRRQKALVRCRQVAIYLADDITGKSLNILGAKFRRDHSVILHSKRKIADALLIDEQLGDDVYLIRKAISARLTP